MLEQRTDRLQTLLVEATGAVANVDQSNADLYPIETQNKGTELGTIFTFGGISTGLGMPVKEFFGAFRNDNRDVVFIKDFRQCWYQRGIVGLSKNRNDTVEAFSSLFERFRRPWTFVGTSAGGFASIYFGIKLDADSIVAISPQSLITRRSFKRFANVPARLRGFNDSDPENDLGYTLKSRLGAQSIKIVYSAGNEYDTEQAQRLRNFDGVSFRPIDSIEHNTAKVLRDRNMLLEYVTN